MLHPQFGGQLTQLRLVRPGPDYAQPDARHRLEHVRHGRDRVLVALVAVQPADRDDQTGVLGDLSRRRADGGAIWDGHEAAVAQPQSTTHLAPLPVRHRDQLLGPQQQRPEHEVLCPAHLLAGGQVIAAAVKRDDERHVGTSGGEHGQRRRQRVVSLHVNQVPIVVDDSPVEAGGRVDALVAQPGADADDLHAVALLGCGQVAGWVGRQQRHIEARRSQPRQYLADVRLQPAHHRRGAGRHHQDAWGDMWHPPS